jgi:hypothetical protein
LTIIPPIIANIYFISIGLSIESSEVGALPIHLERHWKITRGFFLELS